MRENIKFSLMDPTQMIYLGQINAFCFIPGIDEQVHDPELCVGFFVINLNIQKIGGVGD